MTGVIRSRRTVIAALGAAAVLGALALAAPAAAAPAQGEVRVAGGKPIAGSYIVVLKGGATLSKADLAGRYDAAVIRTYTRSVRGYAAKLSGTAARRLAADPRVAYVEQDAEIRLDAVQPNATWGLDRIDQRNLPLNGTYVYDTTASNVRAYVIDTGIRTTHADFGGRASVGFDAIGDGRNGQDCHGHGTHVAGTVGGTTWGVAKGVALVAVRVLNCSGSGTTSGVIAGVDWVTNNAVRPAVANMSLGGGVSSALDQAVRNSIASGITYAIAAGNSNANACNFSPARTAEAITVGATTNTDARASFSNFGTCLDIFAPGQGITSAWSTSNTATNTISGTSMATPHVAGAAALVLAGSPTASPATVRNTMVANATPGVVSNPGSGSPNLLLFTGSGAPPPPPPPPGGFFENTTNVSIPDAGAAVESPIAVTGQSGNAPSDLAVGVDIKHTYRGDLVIDLVAPDGSTYRLKNSNYFDGADNVITTYTVNASTEVANGTWRLRVRDVFSFDVGFIDRWSLQF